MQLQTVILGLASWRRRLGTQNPLVRTSDRRQARALLLLAVLASATVPGAGLAGLTVYESRVDAFAAQRLTRHEITAGDTLYVPQNTVAQYFSADGEPLHLLSGQNRVFKQLGYDSVVYLDDAADRG